MNLDDRHIEAAKMRAAGCTQAETADVVGVSARTIRAWESDGKLEAALSTNGSHPETAELEPETEDLSLSEARRRKETALAEKHELDLQERRGELIRRDDVAFWIEDWGTRIRQSIESFPARYGPQMAGELGVSPRKFVPMLAGYVREYLRELADEVVDAESMESLDETG